MAQIYQDEDFYIETEKSEIPWLKLFTHKPYKELSELPKELRMELWELVNIIEEEMLHHYKPHKINIASFANMLPQVHIHVMARFQNDSYFPNPMWGEKLREGDVVLKDEAEFREKLLARLENR